MLPSLRHAFTLTDPNMSSIFKLAASRTIWIGFLLPQVHKLSHTTHTWCVLCDKGEPGEIRLPMHLFHSLLVYWINNLRGEVSLCHPVFPSLYRVHNLIDGLGQLLSYLLVINPNGPWFLWDVECLGLLFASAMCALAMASTSVFSVSLRSSSPCALWSSWCPRTCLIFHNKEDCAHKYLMAANKSYEGSSMLSIDRWEKDLLRAARPSHASSIEPSFIS